MSRRFLMIVLAVLLPGIRSLAQAPPARPAATAEQLRAWVGELDANEFLARETAMLRLIAAGEPAIAALKNVFLGDSLEATSRALHVLQQIGLSADPQTQEAARAALVEATENEESPVLARRATAVLAHLIELRSTQALVELEALGAKVARAQSFDGAVLSDIVDSVQIGPEFKGGEGDLRRLKWLSVARLILVGDKVTDAWLAHAAQMSGLEELHLHSTAISEEGLAPIAGLAGLRQLGVYYTPLGEKAMGHLARTPGLSFVKLYGTKTPPAAVEKFQQASGVPNVDFRKGAFLGVGCLRGETDCVLSTVHTNSPAEKAGLQPDDIVVRIGEAKVTDFDSLTLLIAEREAGDQIEIEVRRDVSDDAENFRTKNIVAKVTLAPWEVEPAVQNGWRP